jgi:hypothetical protein
MVNPKTPSVSIRPVISYPREAQVGKTYLMTIDLEHEEEEWPYEEEEYPIYCIVQAAPLFKSQPLREPVIVLHRFGGSYGPAQFLLKATHQRNSGEIRVTLISAAGVPVRSPLKLSPIQVIEARSGSLQVGEITEEVPNRDEKIIGQVAESIDFGSIRIEKNANGSAIISGNDNRVVIYQRQVEEDQSAKVGEIGPNPYKGLLAFQETDGDHFFGRDKQIEQLWNKFRSLHEDDSAIRLLPIYGPSGSGKSSLARAGLIPELARRPLPGYTRARVAVLVPGTHPLEALASVLARVATDDLTPATKTREFAEELKQANKEGDYDGLRRIADVLPDMAFSPLIVLVDQFEEVYSLCENLAERDAFIGNLLTGASSRSQHVSVIVTLRSDFLGETQKHPVLNRLFAEQGFLVPTMDEAELRQAISQPAQRAGHPLDKATIELLIKDTEGREGALSLLQFALTRIWEGLASGKESVETLKNIGGVGGALAGEAQRIYESLKPEEQDIARRVFLGLVKLGEGTKDTRRRTEIQKLVSQRDTPEHVKQVIARFAAPEARLITLAANANAETAEVTHEALFDHWRQLNEWLDNSRSDIRFQRRLDDAAVHWDENGRPEGNLWRPPDLDLLRRYHERAGDDMTSLQVEFFQASERANRMDRIIKPWRWFENR